MRRSAFTLVELIMAMSLMVLIVGVVIFSFGQGLRSWQQLAKQAERLQIENLVAERIVKDIRSASLNLAGSTSAEVFLITSTENISYRLIHAKVRRKNGGTTAYLTNDNEIARLVFAYPTAKTVAVTIDGLTFEVMARD